MFLMDDRYRSSGGCCRNGSRRGSLAGEAKGSADASRGRVCRLLKAYMPREGVRSGSNRSYR